MGYSGHGAETSVVEGDRRKAPTGQGSSLLNLLGTDWFRSLSESLAYMLLNGQVLCLAGPFLFLIFKLAAV